MGGRRPLRLTGECEWLLARIAAKPGLTLRSVAAELAERGTPASYGAVWRFLRHEGITLKKTLHVSEHDRAVIARRRNRWKTHQGRLYATPVNCDEAPDVLAGPSAGPGVKHTDHDIDLAQMIWSRRI